MIYPFGNFAFFGDTFGHHKINHTTPLLSFPCFASQDLPTQAFYEVAIHFVHFFCKLKLIRLNKTCLDLFYGGLAYIVTLFFNEIASGGLLFYKHEHITEHMIKQ